MMENGAYEMLDNWFIEDWMIPIAITVIGGLIIAGIIKILKTIAERRRNRLKISGVEFVGISPTLRGGLATNDKGEFESVQQPQDRSATRFTIRFVTDNKTGANVILLNPCIEMKLRGIRQVFTLGLKTYISSPPANQKLKNFPFPTDGFSMIRELDVPAGNHRFDFDVVVNCQIMSYAKTSLVATTTNGKRIKFPLLDATKSFKLDDGNYERMLQRFLQKQQGHMKGY